MTDPANLDTILDIGTLVTAVGTLVVAALSMRLSARSIWLSRQSIQIAEEAAARNIPRLRFYLNIAYKYKHQSWKQSITSFGSLYPLDGILYPITTVLTESEFEYALKVEWVNASSAPLTIRSASVVAGALRTPNLLASDSVYSTGYCVDILNRFPSRVEPNDGDIIYLPFAELPGQADDVIKHHLPTFKIDTMPECFVYPVSSQPVNLASLVADEASAKSIEAFAVAHQARRAQLKQHKAYERADPLDDKHAYRRSSWFDQGGKLQYLFARWVCRLDVGQLSGGWTADSGLKR